jgi:hypothetical protein
MNGGNMRGEERGGSGHGRSWARARGVDRRCRLSCCQVNKRMVLLELVGLEEPRLAFSVSWRLCAAVLVIARG